MTHFECNEPTPIDCLSFRYCEGRVLEAVVPFCMNDLEKQKRYWFLHEWMSSLAFQLNEDLKKFKADIYRYSDLYDVSTGQVLKMNQS